MTGNKNLFSSLVEVNHGQVTICYAKSYKIQSVGDIAFKTKSVQVERMSEVHYVPGLQRNLLSVGHLTKNGFDIRFVDNICTMKKKNHLVANIIWAQIIYILSSLIS